MRFGDPQLLWLILLWPLLVWLGWQALKWRRRVAARVGDPALLERLYPPAVVRWRRRRLWLLLGAVMLLTVAAARPQYGRVEQTLRSVGTNVLIALDVSPSMLARDVQPTRLDAAKRGLRILIQRLAGNRVGIVAFAGSAFLQCPMTLDQRMAALVLSSLDTDSVGLAGTDIGEAIRVAREAFKRGGGEGDLALVLITDGEDHEGRALEQAQQAAEDGIAIYSIGIGTARGAPLREEDGGFKADASGAKVNTQLQMRTLNRLAEATGGKAFAAGDALIPALDDVVTEIQRREKQELEARRQVIHQDRFQWFVAPALGLLLWALVTRPRRTALPGQGSTT